LTLDLDSLEKDVLEIIIDEMKQADSLVAGDVVIDGLTNVLAEPEFSSPGEARRALRVLEEKPLLNEILSQTVLHGPSQGGVQVLIGGEGIYDALSQVSIVLARYGSPNLPSARWAFWGPCACPTARLFRWCVSFPGC